MKAAALVASFVIHVGALLAVPNDPKTDASTASVEPSATQTSMIASHVPSCACDLEIAACPPSQER